jgi:hypothetical protein
MRNMEQNRTFVMACLYKSCRKPTMRMISDRGSVPSLFCSMEHCRAYYAEKSTKDRSANEKNENKLKQIEGKKCRTHELPPCIYGYMNEKYKIVYVCSETCMR